MISLSPIRSVTAVFAFSALLSGCGPTDLRALLERKPYEDPRFNDTGACNEYHIDYPRGRLCSLVSLPDFVEWKTKNGALFYIDKTSSDGYEEYLNERRGIFEAMKKEQETIKIKSAMVEKAKRNFISHGYILKTPKDFSLDKGEIPQGAKIIMLGFYKSLGNIKMISDKSILSSYNPVGAMLLTENASRDTRSHMLDCDRYNQPCLMFLAAHVTKCWVSIFGVRENNNICLSVESEVIESAYLNFEEQLQQ